ncbi:MAG: GNAT family N-acetyltransferase [Planctomycetota bacterium]|nr:GNAT family N-acetyltransferase [Planctomycetota bacterium]
MSTRAVEAGYAADAAALVQLARERPSDLIDPFPPSQEFEVLADAGARGKEADVHPRMALEGQDLVGYGAVDFARGQKVAMLVGPIVHPAHRRKGHGKMLFDDLLGQAKTAKQKRICACIGAENGGGRAFARAMGFKQKETHTVLRISLPFDAVRPEVKNVRVRRANYDHAALIHEYCRGFIPRNEKQTRSLLKTGGYAILMAEDNTKMVGLGELDMRYGDTATVEFLDGKSSLINKGLGNLILAEMIETASNQRGVENIDLLVKGTDAKRIEAYEKIGFELRYEALLFERSV